MVYGSDHCSFVRLLGKHCLQSAGQRDCSPEVQMPRMLSVAPQRSGTGLSSSDCVRMSTSNAALPAAAEAAP
jgi:hypothetical protein